jgi:sRNA-binding protein
MPGRERRRRLWEEASQQFVALRVRWPKAFPVNGRDVRPLAVGVARIIAAEMGWSVGYARAILGMWKARDPYCRACLLYAKRIALDGSLTDELVDDEARAMARELIERRKERKQREAEALHVIEAPLTEPQPEPQPMIAAPAPGAPSKPPPPLVPSGPMDETWKRAKAAVEAWRQAEKEGTRQKDPCGYFAKKFDVSKKYVEMARELF